MNNQKFEKTEEKIEKNKDSSKEDLKDEESEETWDETELNKRLLSVENPEKKVKYFFYFKFF